METAYLMLISKKLLNFHNNSKKLVTVTAVRPPARFGELEIKNKIVKSFKEKPQVTSGWINGGFFVAKKIFEFDKRRLNYFRKISIRKSD